MGHWIPLMFFVFVSAGNIFTISPVSARNVRIEGGNKVLVSGSARMNIKTITPANGTPFFDETYKFADIRLKNGRVFMNVKTRIDLVIQTTYFISSNGIEINIDPGMVKEISYSDTTADGIVFYKFQTGFPAVNRQNTNNFYIVLAEGRCSFLKSVLKKEIEKQNVLYGSKEREYETFEEYYLFAKGEMKKLKKDTDFILSELSDKQAEVKQFIQDNKLNIKKNEHLARLIDYYNTL